MTFRILHVLDHSIPMHSGYTFRTRNILRQQRDLGWHTSHVTGLKHHDTPLLQEEVDGLLFYRTPSSSSLVARIPILNQLQVISTLEKRLDEVIALEKPDILHAHSPALTGIAALRAGSKHGIPVVYECRAFWEDAAVDHGTSSEWGLRYRLSRAMETYVFRKSDAVTTICDGLRGDILERGVAAEKVTTIPNAVDIDGFSVGLPASQALIESLALEGKEVLGFIGSFYAYEGLELLLDALTLIHRQRPDVALLLVGGGPEEEKLKQKVISNGLQGKVVMTGRVPHADVAEYYNLVDIFVYPRLSMRLTNLVTPLKPLEAMAQGRLVVASDVGGHRELIEHAKTGYLHQADSAESLAATVERLLTSRDEWPVLRKAGRAFVEEERSWAASVGRYQSVYGSLV